MGKFQARPEFPHPRKYRRYNLRYPVQVQFGSGDSVSKVIAVSENVSLGGVLLAAEKPIPQDSSVMLTMTIAGDAIVRPIQLKAHGRVVRIKKAHPGFAIAVECIRPIAQMKSLLRTSSQVSFS
jgi:hypothetical protein